MKEPEGLYHCPRDGSTLIPPDKSKLGVFSRHGSYHCEECAGMLLNANSAQSSFCSEKLEKMHNEFTDGTALVDLCCPFCSSQMGVRNFSFQRIDGELTDSIEIDGCPNCSSFWLDAGELQRLSPSTEIRSKGSEANALAIVLEVLFQLPIILV